METILFSLFIIVSTSWFFAGVVQVLVGLGMVISTKDLTIRKHMAYYLAGVAGYFLVLWAATAIDHSDAYSGFTLTWFFAGSISLFLYHTLILYRREFLS